MEGLPELLRNRAAALRQNRSNQAIARNADLAAKEIELAAEHIERLHELARTGRAMRLAQARYFGAKTAELLRGAIALEREYDRQIIELLGDPKS